ncbi:hypothetical protein MRB53_022431 [Persea americana]|uniref:Uncharacterized protein n=1 Tax=Persea americana TaxID=3435 RepID=A0ACC2L768_PERAE|nr:hypothetical protein MRB53_022431 [Persea americana]
MEEENDLSISPIDLSKTLNPRSQKKHATMIERLSNLHHSRLNQSISRRSDADSSAPCESTQAFLNRFADSKRSVESEIDCLRFISNDLESNPQLKSGLEKLSISIADLEKLVAENSYFLPSYEVRSTLKAIAELKGSLESVSLKLVPRKKFSFRNKLAQKDPANAVKESEISAKESNFPVNGGDDAAAAASAEKSRFETRDSPGFRNQLGAVLVKQFQGFESGDFALSNLESCEIRLKGRLRALFVHRLRNCRVFVGPVLGSILIEEAEGCLFMLASHQIRIHHAKATDFYLRVRSRPIIEDCSSVRFATYLLVYEGIEEELRESGLAEDTGNWANVDDFRWLRAVQSPNWCILPKEEQVCTVNISDLENQR